MNLEITVPSNVDVATLDTAKPLEEIFKPFEETLAKWEAKAFSLVVTDISQKTEMQQARLARLELKEARVNMDKTRKGLVEGLKARTGKIDGFAKAIREKLESLESVLLESEQFADRYAARVKAELKLKRETELMPFMETPILGDLSELSEADYANVLSSAKLAKQAKAEALAKAEAERLAKIEADRLERERIEAENSRLKAEAVEAARLAELERQRVAAEREEERKKAANEAAQVAEIARKEREAIEAKAKTEREAAQKEAARLKAELDAKERLEAAEAKRKLDEQRAAEKAQKDAAAAPDKAKLQTFADSVRMLNIPEMINEAVRGQIQEQVTKFAVWVEAQIPKL